MVKICKTLSCHQSFFLKVTAIHGLCNVLDKDYTFLDEDSPLLIFTAVRLFLLQSAVAMGQGQEMVGNGLMVRKSFEK